MSLLAKISASGSDTVARLLVNSSPLQSRIAGELKQRGLEQLSGTIERGFIGLSSYSFVYRADIGNTDNRAWSDDFLRSMIAAAIQAATTYDASVSIESRPSVGATTSYPLGGGVIPGGKVQGGDTPQGDPDSVHVPIIGSVLGAADDLAKGLGTTGKVLMIAVGVLVVGGVILVLSKPETIGRAVRG